MASMICLIYKTQQSYESIEDKEFAIKAVNADVDKNFLLIAKGNIIEGVEARY